MKTVTSSDLQDDSTHYLELAEAEDILISRMVSLSDFCAALRMRTTCLSINWKTIRGFLSG